MAEAATAVDPYILYSLLGLIILVGLALLGTVFRLLHAVGKIEGRLTGLESAVADLRQDHASLRQDHANLRQEMHQEFGRVWEQLGHLREQVAENRGLLLALHERIDLVMRHRHDDRSGAVLLTPSEPVPDPAAD